MDSVIHPPGRTVIQYELLERPEPPIILEPDLREFYEHTAPLCVLSSLSKLGQRRSHGSASSK